MLCGWTSDIDLIVAEIVQPARFDDLQALFMSVAESIVILPPMRHVG